MKQTLTKLAVIAAVLAVFFLGGFWAGLRTAPTPTVSLADTTTVIDTMRKPVPPPKIVEVVRFDKVSIAALSREVDSLKSLLADSNPDMHTKSADSTHIVTDVRSKRPFPTHVGSNTRHDILKRISKRAAEAATKDVFGDSDFADSIELPIEQKTYKTEDYKAVIEGFRPSLVSMEVYRQTQFIDRVQTLTIPDTRRWSFGPTIGYGMTVQNGRLVGVPTIGLSAQYSLIKW